jgi:hypothetical protein
MIKKVGKCRIELIWLIKGVLRHHELGFRKARKPSEATAAKEDKKEVLYGTGMVAAAARRWLHLHWVCCALARARGRT